MRRALAALLCLSLVGAPTFAARDFESGDADQVESTTVMDQSRPFTVYAKNKYESSVTGIVFGLCSTATSANYTVAYDRLTKRRAQDYTAIAEATVTITTGVWEHGAYAFAADNDRTVWSEGADEVNNTTSIAAEAWTHDRTTIGFLNNLSPNAYYDGEIDHVAVLSGAGTVAHALDHKNGRDPRTFSFASRLLVRFQEQNTSDTPQDVCGGLTFTVTNTPAVTGSVPVGW